MSLTNHLRNPNSPVTQFIRQHFPQTSSITKVTNKYLRDVHTINPGFPSWVYRTIGQAIDYRIRYYFGITRSDRLVAWEGAWELLSSEDQWKLYELTLEKWGRAINPYEEDKEGLYPLDIIVGFFTQLDSHAPPQTAMQRLIWYARARLALAQGKPDRALALTEQLFAPAANGADEQSLPHLAHLRGKALTRLNQLAEAETALQAAHAVAMTRGIRPLLWRIAIDLGHLYQGQRRDEEVEQARALAQELIEALAACIPDPALHDHFLQQATALLPRPQPLSPRRAAKRAFAGLTQREREVAVLIAEGKSNREIADVLVVNYRTIEAHVSNILSKLGLTSRAQIAVWATEKGLRKTEQQFF